MEQTGRRSTAASCFFHTQSPYFAVPHRRAGRLAAALLVGADAPGRLLLPLRGNSPSALIGPPHRLCRGGPCGRPQAGVGTRPTSLYFLPSRIATHQGGPACPFKAIYLLSASAPWAGTSPAPTPRLPGAPAQKDTPQAMPAACPPLLPFFSSVCGRSPDPARPSLSVPGPHRHRHGCRMPWRTLDPA